MPPVEYGLHSIGQRGALFQWAIHQAIGLLRRNCYDMGTLCFDDSEISRQGDAGDRGLNTREKAHIEDQLLNPEYKAGTDWFTKLATVERAKAIRREAQKARRGKPITFSSHLGWPRSS